MRFTSAVIALAAATVASAQQIVQIVDSTDFCLFMPTPGQEDMNISDSEQDATVYCLGNAPDATGAGKLPSGFILSAHYVSTSDYVQITGQINPAAAGLNVTDDGGQYDVAAPNGASCSGYQYFVQLIEPSGNDYCIRCCNSATDCNRGISEAGCARIVPGDFSGPGVPTGSVSSSAVASSSAAASSSVASSSVASSSAASSSALPSSSSKPASQSSKPAPAASSSLPTEAVSAQSESGAADLMRPAMYSMAALAVAMAFF
ncbi:hypothetical protein INT43_004296 [Umbelopsis isabellina]|uniref:Uncharacterized protein n=1 Tax=Mortierella isabellina TaxID=91625 RepID=A0A8H7PHW5_MORIS|nr:hypothetical protein INT43_004296 [Umbelopsis isabellina]